MVIIDYLFIIKNKTMEIRLQAQVNKGDMFTRGPEFKVFGWRERSSGGRCHISDFFKDVF